MNNDLNTMQESIKIALDAADAATDVTSEYKRMKTEYLKAEQKVKEIHKYTTVIFSASIGTAIVAILLTGLLYFKSLSELEDMTNTSREALVVFAENVESVNKAVDNINQSLEKHSDLVNTNAEIKNKLSELMDAIDQNDKNLMISLSKEISNLSKSVSSSIKNEAGKLSSNIQEGDVFILNETFLYDNGEEEFRRWEITKTGERTYEGNSSDIIGVAKGERLGNAVNWHYTLKLKYGDGILNVKFDDWLIMQDEKNVFNKATMKKFGVRLGDVYLFFRK